MNLPENQIVVVKNICKVHSLALLGCTMTFCRNSDENCIQLRLLTGPSAGFSPGQCVAIQTASGDTRDIDIAVCIGSYGGRTRHKLQSL